MHHDRQPGAGAEPSTLLVQETAAPLKQLGLTVPQPDRACAIVGYCQTRRAAGSTASTHSDAIRSHCTSRIHAKVADGAVQDAHRDPFPDSWSLVVNH